MSSAIDEVVVSPDPPHLADIIRNAMERRALMVFAPGTRVKAEDRDNYGTVLEDIGDKCRVEFISREGNRVEKTLPKSELSVATGESLNIAAKPTTAPMTFSQLAEAYPHRREPIISRLLRAGETMNVIGAAKAGKSWLILSLLLSVATGRQWLGRSTTPGRVLLIDNELHPEELHSRIASAITTMDIDPADIEDTLHVKSLRGDLMDIHGIARMVESLADQKYSLVAIDAFYRTLPAGTNENDNAAMAALYNRIDSMAGALNCAVVLNHHASKGDQSAKAVTDVGSGAGSISRAADTHLIIRPHELEGHAVIDGVCRSFPPIEPATLRYEYPRWSLAEDIEPKVLRPQNRAGSDNAQRDQDSDATVFQILETGPKSNNEIRNATGWGKARVDRSIDRLTKTQRIIFFSTTDQKTKKEIIKYAIPATAIE